MSKNILFIGPYRQLDGWGEAARQWIKALIKTGHNIQIRPVFFINKLIDVLPLEIAELEYNKLDEYDAVIQNVLPHYFEYNSNFGKNIGLTAVETRKWKNIWPRKLEMMDQIWVPSEYSHECVARSSKADACIIPIPQDLNKFSREYNTVSSELLKDKFIFYFIGEYIHRKNLDTLVRAFHSEFHPSEPVELIIKTNKLGLQSPQLIELLEARFKQIKERLRMYGSLDDYKPELLITDHMSEDDLNSLHKTCDCFVMPSAGEAWSIPAVDAAGFGKQVIMTPTGAYHFADHIVESRWTNVNSRDKPLDNLFTGYEEWLEPDFLSLRKKMRLAFELKQAKPKDMSVLSYEKVGDLMCQAL